MIGIGNTKEVLLAGFALTEAIALAAKDGVDLSDVLAVAGNDKVKAAIAAAAKEISLVPAEIKDLDLAEGFELIGVCVGAVPKILEALKK